MNLRSLNVAPRAVLFFSVIVLIVFALGGVAVVQMGKLYDAEQEVETNWLPGNQLAAKMSGGLLRLRLESLRATTTPDPQLRAQTVAAFPGYREAIRWASGRGNRNGRCAYQFARQWVGLKLLEKA